MNLYNSFKLFYRQNRKFVLFTTTAIATCVFFFDFIYLLRTSSISLSKNIIGRQNKQFRFGRMNLDDFYHLGFKFNDDAHTYRTVNKPTFSALFCHRVSSSNRGIIIKSFQNQDKESIIKNFLCHNLESSVNTVCDRLLYHHTCTFDNSISRNPLPFVINLAMEIATLMPEFGFETNIEEYKCELTPGNNECIKDLIVNPLKDFARRSSKIYLLVINFVEECYVKDDHYLVSIYDILRYLSIHLPAQFKFVVISKGDFKEDVINRVFRKKHKLSRFDLFDALKQENTGSLIGHNELLENEPGKEIGDCSDAVDVILVTVFYLSLQVLKVEGIFKDPLFIAWCFYNTKFVVTHGTALYFCLIFFLYYAFRNIEQIKDIAVHYDWFYKLNILCDDIDIHCFVDRRLEAKYYQFNNLHRRETFAENFVERKKVHVEALSRNDLSEFELLYQLKSQRIHRDQTKLRGVLLEASGRRMDMICRWIMLHTQNNGVSNKDIDQALEIAFENYDENSAKAISWTITKYFFRTFSAYLLNATEIYPAIQCTRHSSTRLVLCSNHKSIVIHSIRRVRGVPSTYKSFGIVYHNTEKNIKLIFEITRQYITTSRYIKLNISRKLAETLFKKHSNLTLICPCPFRPIFDMPHDSNVTEEHCLLLFCWKKGYIPIGESHFPKKICDIPTLIIEGVPRLMSNLRVGDKIGTHQSMGTLGGFLNYHGFDSFLTCAHVMYDLKTLVSSDFFNIPESSALNYMVNPPVPCGKVIRKVFDHDDRSKTSIDAAVVLIQNALVDQTDYISGTQVQSGIAQLGLATKFINESACLHHEEFCILEQSTNIVAPGAMTKLEKQNVKFSKQVDIEVDFPLGSTSAQANGRVFNPLILSHPAHMQLSAGVPGQKSVFCMYNQMVLNLDLKPGDSGTCIYIVNNPNNKNGCIGMAIAFCNGISIVTPIKDILRRISS